MQVGYESEQDLFVARSTIEMLIKEPSDTTKARALRDHFSSQPQTPILNFVDVLIECLELKEYDLVKQMATVDYAAELKRDTSLFEKVNTVCEKVFGQGIKKQNQM